MPIPRPDKVFAALETPRLVELATLLRIRDAARLDRGTLVDLLATAGDREYPDLLRRLSAAELRQICARVGYRNTHGEPDELVARLTRTGDRPTAEPEPAPARPTKRTPRGDPGLEATLWRAADRLRSNLDAAEYKHVVLGLLFLKFVAGAARAPGALPATSDRAGESAEKTTFHRFVVPPEARWDALVARRDSPHLGRDLDAAMVALEHHNPRLRGALPQIFQRPGLEPARLGELLALLDDLAAGPGATRDLLGRVYEYFLAAFASAEGKNGGQFYTPASVVALLVAALAPVRGAVYDPACGSGGMFVQSERFLAARGGARDDLRFFGQESNPTTWRLARMNLAVHGLGGDLGPVPADSFARDLHPDLRADYVLANPPFNARAWATAALEGDPRFAFGQPPPTNANFAWLQHIVHHLAPGGRAAVVLANGSLTASGREGELRRALVEADLVDGVIALPGQLFYATTIPVCVWLLAKGRAGRTGRVLMIDARDLGEMIDRTHRALRPADVDALAAIVHAWREDPVPEGMSRAPYRDVPGRCRAVDLATLAAHEFSLAPARHVAAPAAAAEDGGFAERFAALRGELEAQLARAAALDREIAAALARVEVP